jgi:hypothetical protein
MVSVEGEFSVPDNSKTIVDQSVSDVRLTADVSLGIDANVQIDRYELQLKVGETQDNLTLIAQTQESDVGTKQLNTSHTLEGSLLTGPWSVEDFAPNGGEVSHPIRSELRCDVFRNDEHVAQAVGTDSFTISVNEERVTVNQDLSGSGETTITTQ